MRLLIVCLSKTINRCVRTHRSRKVRLPPATGRQFFAVSFSHRDSQEAGRPQAVLVLIHRGRWRDSGILLRDTRGTTSTKVESAHDLMWSSSDLVALIH